MSMLAPNILLMKKTLIALVLFTFVLTACSQENNSTLDTTENQEPVMESEEMEVQETDTEEMQVETDVEFMEFTSEDFTFKYPDYFVKDEERKEIVFIDPEGGDDSTQIQISMAEGSDTKHLLDQPSTGEVTVGGEVWDFYVSETGYCDAGQCSSPYIAYGIYSGEKTYYVMFYNQTEETELSRQVVETFNLL